MRDIVNISIQYVNYGFISNYHNCLLVCINKDLLVFLTAEGTTKSVDLKDQENVKVSVTLACQV